MGEPKKRGVKKIVSKPKDKINVMSPSELRRQVYKIFEIYGFFIVDGKYLYAFVRYLDYDGCESFASRLFMSTIEFIPFEIREDMYRDMSGYLYKRFVTNPHLMPRDKEELVKHMKWNARKIEVLQPI